MKFPFSLILPAFAFTLLTGCTSALLPPIQTLPTGKAIALQTVLSENSGTYGCINYQPSSDSCKSQITFSLTQEGYQSRETGAASSFGSTQRINVISNGTFRGGRGCISHSDVTVEAPSDQSAQSFAQKFIRDTIIRYGGACTTMYTASNGYVARTVGGDGRIFPPGDSTIHFFDAPKTIRAQ